MDTATNPFAADVVSSRTREEARAKVLRRILLNLYKNEYGDQEDITRLIGTQVEIQNEFSKILTEAEQTLQEAENALVADLRAFFPELQEGARDIAKSFAGQEEDTPLDKTEVSSVIFNRVFKRNGAVNTYLLDKVPEFQQLVDEINTQFHAQGITACIVEVDIFSYKELRFRIKKTA